MNDATRKRLIEVAAEAARAAYCPYSGFAVGAAVLAEDGRVFAGCNVENASFGLTVCAERTALGSAVAAGVRHFKAIAIVSDRTPHPCGACRQVMAEFCDPDFAVLVASLDALDAPREFRLGDLLPHPFGPDGLKPG